MSEKKMGTASRLEVLRAALAAARIGGCNCAPNITIREQGGVAFATVEHDANCSHPKARAGGAN